MNTIITKIYIYLTDFTINLANLLGISYEDINALIFCVGFPLILFILTIAFIYQKFNKKDIEIR
jgi:hypothetical protein